MSKCKNRNSRARANSSRRNPTAGGADFRQRRAGAGTGALSFFRTGNAVILSVLISGAGQLWARTTLLFGRLSLRMEAGWKDNC
ncbi:hypothetical protein BURKHO8Y_210328 [Burkholderia sp. 8Y]|nr:hypothetical protein BURKHO8Y_210328 [Burkholderia sp. 8Y]